MAGTRDGGILAAQTNKERHGEDYYSKLGKKASISYNSKPKEERKPRGFACNPETARSAGSKGGTISKRVKIHVRFED